MNRIMLPFSIQDSIHYVHILFIALFIICRMWGPQRPNSRYRCLSYCYPYVYHGTKAQVGNVQKAKINNV